MRNVLRVLAFDVVVPLAIIGALLMIGVILGWPLWWVSVCSILCFLVAQAVVVNILLYRRDSVTMGTDDDAPGLRLVAVGIATVALAVAATVGYTRWTLTDRTFAEDTTDVVRIATDTSEATATFNPGDPAASVDRAAAMMAPERAEGFKAQFAPATADMVKRRVTATASTISAGLEAMAPSSATVAVLMRATQTEPGQQPSTAVLALRVALSKIDGDWKVVDVAPINAK